MADERDITDARQIEILDWLWGNAALPVSATVKVSLWAGDPHDTGTEVSTSGTNYVRRTFNNDGTFWTTGSAMLKQSLVAVRFPESGDATADWAGGATLSHLGIHESGGTIWLRCAGNSALTVMSGGNTEIPAGGIRLTLKETEGQNAWAEWSSALRIGVWDKIFGGDAFTPPEDVQFSLWNGEPFGDGNECSETGTGYERITLANDNVTWGMAALIKVNAVEVNFADSGDLTATLGQVTHLGIHDAASGDLIAQLPHPAGGVFVDIGDPVIFEPGALRMGLWWNEFEYFYPA